MHDAFGYSLDTLIYEGDETSVYRGKRLSDGTPVAVKTTRGDFPSFRAASRLRREDAILRALDAPRVPRALDLCARGRALALVMDDLGGTNLASFIASRGRLAPKDALRIAIPLAQTLAALHRARVVHKDVKPHNVMIDPATLAPSLVDFGIATRLSREAQEVVAPDELEGTPAYLAPEQTGKTNHPVDRRADLYSLGVTLYEMLAGARPFSGEDAAEIVHAHLTHAPQALASLGIGVPLALSAIVTRLLAKAPEERYQSAEGLAADLERCAKELEETGAIAPFELGAADLVDEIVWPDKLFGRDAEIAALAEALARAARGGLSVALAKGPSGVGKSALVHALFPPGSPSFAEGKFEEAARGVPLSALSQALRSLCRQCLSESNAALAGRRRAIGEALGSAGRLVTELCPDLEILIGPQPEVAAVGPNEAKNRLALLVRRFLMVFAREGAPLVLFMDDLQWADAASLELLTALLSDPDTHHLLFIGSYRDDEVTSALAGMRNTLALAGAPPLEMTLAPLGPDAVTSLVAEALSCSVTRAAGIGAIAWTKTGGNPFFLAHFFRSLERSGVVAFDPALRGFTWDEARVREAMVTDNVLSLMTRKIVALGDLPRRALVLGASIGAQFELGTLAPLLGLPAERAAALLWPALDEGLLVPIGGDYRLLDAAVDVPEEAARAVSYRFLHDRVREAAGSLLPEEERAATHAAIGRLLWARHRDPSGPRDEALLDVARHVNLGAAAIDGSAERTGFAKLNLQAGRVARARAAYDAAAALFAYGRVFLGENGFSEEREAAFSLALEGAECSYLSGAAARGDELLDDLAARAESAMEKARVSDVRLRARMTQARFVEAIEAGVFGLSAFGVSFPETAVERNGAFGQGIGLLASLFAERRLEDLAEAQLIEDPEEQMIQKLLGELTMPAYFAVPSLYGPVNVELVRRSLVHGQTEGTPFAFMAYAFMLGALFGRGAEAVALGQAAIDIAERRKSDALLAKLHVVYANFAYVREPLRALLPHLDRGLRAALFAGDYVYLASTSYSKLAMLFAAGRPLEDVQDEIEGCFSNAVRTQDVIALSKTRLVRQVMRALAGRTRGPSSLDDDDFDGAAERAALDERQHGVALFYWHAFEAFLRVIAGEPALALASIEEAEKRSASVMGLYWTVNLSYLTALTRAALAMASEGEARALHVAAIEPHRAKLAAIAEGCPSNFRHKLALVDAELAALAGAPWEALTHYDRAITFARENEHLHDEALANERAARFLISVGKPRAGDGYLADAYRGFAAWGAEAKASRLAVELRGALGSLAPRALGDVAIEYTGAVTTAQTGATITRARRGALKDAALVLRAAQAIAGEIVLARVVSRLMRIVLENSGAERGVLLLAQGESLFVEATLRAQPEAIEVGIGRALEEEPDIAQKVVLSVWRGREPLVLDDAPGDVRFRSDPYLERSQVKSVFCTPVSYQGRPTGVLYLENASATGVFTAVRAELCGLLATQAAIAIENALLVERIQEANQEVQAANSRLEDEVRQRTLALEASNAELLTATSQLMSELEQRGRDEAARAELQMQVLAAQEARLAELSAPLLPIAEGVLLLPIVGAMDAERAARVMDVALEGASSHGARALILDITGMRHVDASGVASLLAVANALRLVGTEPLVTGVRAQVARAMVEEDVGLVGISTLSTLKAGIARALSSGGARLHRETPETRVGRRPK